MCEEGHELTELFSDFHHYWRKHGYDECVLDCDICKEVILGAKEEEKDPNKITPYYNCDECRWDACIKCG